MMRGGIPTNQAAGPPFPVGVPVGQDDMIDRVELLDELVARLGAGQSLLLAGPRRTGKSGVGHEALRRLRAANVYVASVDLFHVASLEELAVRLLGATLENRIGPWSRAVHNIAVLRDALASVRLTAKVHDLELGLALSAKTLSPEDALDVAVATGERIAARDGKRLVVLMDEFQEVERIGGDALFRRLRALMQAASHTAYLFLGSRPSLLRALFSQHSAAFYRFALPMEMPPIPEAAWRTYLRRKLASHRLTITDSAVNLLLERTGGHPWCTMEVISEAWMMRGEETTIDAEHVILGYNRALDRLTPVYEAEWQEVRRVRHADLVLKSLVAGAPPFDGQLNSGTVTRALHHLIDMAVVEHGTKRGEYLLVEKMFGEWVRSYISS